MEFRDQRPASVKAKAHLSHADKRSAVEQDFGVLPAHHFAFLQRESRLGPNHEPRAVGVKGAEITLQGGGQNKPSQ